MVLTDWTLDGKESLDISVKYAGNASVKIVHDVLSVGSAYSLYRTGYNTTQAQVIAWARGSINDKVHPAIRHASYGRFHCSTGDTWTKFRVSFWYDAPNNTKFGRKEYWNGSAWIQDGEDRNCGLGAPSAGLVYLEARRLYDGGGTEYIWFDEVEMYEASL